MTSSSQGLRVSYLINHYPKVSHAFIRREILALERRGVQVIRIAARGWADSLPDAEDRDEQVRTRYLLRRGVRGLLAPVLHAMTTRPLRFLAAMHIALTSSRRSGRSVLQHLAYVAEACQVVRWTKDERVAHVHAHFGTNPADVAMLARVLGGPPYSFTVHGPEEFDQPEALRLAAKVKRAAFVVAVSSFGRSQLLRWLPPRDWARVEIVHCGIDRAFHTLVHAPDATRPRLVCVGRLCAQKGQLLLVEAVGRVIARGIPLELVLAGDGEMRPEIESLIDRLKLRLHIRITGWISSERVREELLAAQALVLPSFAEGLPVVIMEAMALRRPVITTYVAGIPELVRDEECGWLVAAGDLEGLVGAIEACLATSPAERERMGAAAHQRVVERHDVDREAAKLVALFAASCSGDEPVNT